MSTEYAILREPSKPHVITPEAAQEIDTDEWMRHGMWLAANLAYTVATEPERIAVAERATVVKALRALAVQVSPGHSVGPGWIEWRADQIKNGADYA